MFLYIGQALIWPKTEGKIKGNLRQNDFQVGSGYI
jgi:hypothetical protein